ncbi:hypothetical protein FH972_024243 [Carpinus fangiana]|uniref:Dolichyl-phosphate-mannose--protein mannosyltransferase 4 n=1 Tax=Carpinus fangiana TaxID=176857 RepID=A0A5N6KXT1_9ROSI|nr:hypothetical protein FH972_024243 [Carpinus fangiana]
MSSPQDSLRKRGGKRPTSPNPDAASTNGQLDLLSGAKQLGKEAKQQARTAVQKTKQAAATQWDYRVAILALTVAAFVTRFWGIGHPDQVVFDEVHFGKFASYYLQRMYFFDVHPPFGKLLFAFAGWLVGYNGDFLFENIGDSYIVNKVPYVAYRAMPATLGALTVPTVFDIMWESGYSLPACITAAAIVLLDNAHIGQTRLILLDATLILSMALSVLSYVKFYKKRHEAFSRKWWKWLLVTGLSLSCVISTKYVGVFTFISIGIPVAIDLWELLDIKRPGGALSLPDFGKHLVARVLGLIIVPFFVYLFWFQVHFAILTKSGPGDDFMTPEFQETLSDNALVAQSVGINYYDALTFRHKDTKVFLHSHPDLYPLRYDDGRVSSQGQQVTGYPHEDLNNQWQIYPTKPLEGVDGHSVLNGDIIKLRHLVTDTWLLSHDVASPTMPTNQEFTTISTDDSNGPRFNDTLFEISMNNGKPGQEFRSKSSHFKLIHIPSRVAMWTHTTPLPDWGYKQAEINGNKAIIHSSNTWYVEDLPQLPADSPRLSKEPKKPKTLSFMRKWLELQRAMFFHNNALTASHPYASFPVQWPFLLRGVSFWTKESTREQIYFLGNPLGWWFASSLLAVFAGIIGADQLSQRRGIDALDSRTRNRLYKSTGFFFLTWAAHYFPFFVMGRQLFLHHYLPAHLASALVAGSLIEFIFTIEPADPANPASARTRQSIRAQVASRSFFGVWAATGVILTVLGTGYVYFSPLTYGSPGLSVSGVVNRKWLGYDLHFAK